MKLFTVTYDIITPESAEQGDTSDNGFVAADGTQHSAAGIWGERAAALGNECAMSLRDALAVCSGPFEDSGSWFTESDSRQDYSSGAETRLSLHPSHRISPASYARLQKLLKV